MSKRDDRVKCPSCGAHVPEVQLVAPPLPFVSEKFLFYCKHCHVGFEV